MARYRAGEAFPILGTCSSEWQGGPPSTIPMAAAGGLPVHDRSEVASRTRGDTLGKLYDRLVTALSKASSGFEWGLFGNVPKGFALVARMERIKDDGTPYPGPARWLSEGTPLITLSDFLGNLFFEKPGHFRIISFVVTDDVNFQGDTSAKLPSISSGARDMPRELRQVPYGPDLQLLALVYTFERKSGAQITAWEGGAPSAQQHLAAAGVLFGAPPR